jgi:hypothetical protein
MKLTFAIFIFLSSQIAMGYVEFPSNCVSSPDVVCHFGTVKKISSYSTGNLHVYMGKETLLKKETDRLEWVYGPVLFEVESKSLVYFKKHQITLQKGKYLFFGVENALKVDVLDGVFGLGTYEVTEGFQGSFSMAAGQMSFDPLQAIDLKEHLVRYVNVKKLNREQASKYMDEFVPKHKNYLAWAVELNENLMKRSIAYDRKLLHQEMEAKRRLQVVLEKRKADFFSKVFER